VQLVAGLEAVPYPVMKAFVERLDPAIMCEMAMMSVFKVGSFLSAHVRVFACLCMLMCMFMHARVGSHARVHAHASVLAPFWAKWPDTSVLHCCKNQLYAAGACMHCQNNNVLMLMRWRSFELLSSFLDMV